MFINKVVYNFRITVQPSHQDPGLTHKRIKETRVGEWRLDGREAAKVSSHIHILHINDTRVIYRPKSDLYEKGVSRNDRTPTRFV